VSTDYQTLLQEAGLALAIEPLRQLFAREHVDDPRAQSALTREVIECTVAAFSVFTRPRTLH
jgi:hypothetical protein